MRQLTQNEINHIAGGMAKKTANDGYNFSAIVECTLVFAGAGLGIGFVFYPADPIGCAIIGGGIGAAVSILIVGAKLMDDFYFPAPTVARA